MAAFTCRTSVLVWSAKDFSVIKYLPVALPRLMGGNVASHHFLLYLLGLLECVHVSLKPALEQ